MVTFDVTATESCTGAVDFYDLYGPNGLMKDSTVGSRSVPRYTDLGRVNGQTVDGYLALGVPADASEPLVIEWKEWWTPGSETVVATSRAALDGIGALSG